MIISFIIIGIWYLYEVFDTKKLHLSKLFILILCIVISGIIFILLKFYAYGGFFFPLDFTEGMRKDNNFELY